MEVPGVDTSNIEVQIIDEQIILVTLRKPAPEIDEKAVYRECKYGNITRRIKLPSKVMSTCPVLNVSNGMLVLNFSKVEQ